jgi:hypothetical protein
MLRRVAPVVRSGGNAVTTRYVANEVVLVESGSLASTRLAHVERALERVAEAVADGRVVVPLIIISLRKFRCAELDPTGQRQDQITL